MANARTRLSETKSTKHDNRERISKRNQSKKIPPTKDKTKSSIKNINLVSTSAKTKLRERSRSDSKDKNNEKSKNITKPNNSKQKELPKMKGIPGEDNNNRRATQRVSTKQLISLEEDLTDILTMELTKKSHSKVVGIHPDTAAQEPQIITMKPKVSPDSTSDPSTSSPRGKNSTKRKQPKPLQNPPTHLTFQQHIESVHNPLSIHQEDKLALILPVSVDNHKANKIEDMNVLRSMLKLPKIQLSNGVEITVPLSSGGSAYECDHCGRAFRAKPDLRKHMLIHLDIRPHACPLCPSTFRQRGNLKTHMGRMHAAALPTPDQFICHHCGARFFVKEAIRAHVIKHELVKAYPCPDCGKAFARDILLRAHRRSQHGVCRFYCYLCSASYPARSALDTHIKRHMGVRDLACHICGKTFDRIDCVKKHVASLHQDFKRVQCPVCAKWLKGHLREHMRTHVQSKPYACLECGKRFAQTSQLSVHKRSHTGIKPYVCRICKRPFSHSNALILHIRVHTGEKPFECAMCPQTFSQLPHMKAHMRSIHNKTEAYKCADCGEFFKLRATLREHQALCVPPAVWLERHERAAVADAAPGMSVSRMRFLLAVLLQTIADKNRLHLLGFNKRLIDELLVDSLEATGHAPLKDPRLPPAARLRHNIQLLLNWTVPPDIMRRYRHQNKTTEQLLEELTS